MLESEILATYGEANGNMYIKQLTEGDFYEDHPNFPGKLALRVYHLPISCSVNALKPGACPEVVAAQKSLPDAGAACEEEDAVDRMNSVSHRRDYMKFLRRCARRDFPEELVPELRKKARAKIKQYGKPTRQNDVAESVVAKLLCSILGWKFFVQMRLIRTRLKL